VDDVTDDLGSRLEINYLRSLLEDSQGRAQITDSRLSTNWQYGCRDQAAANNHFAALIGTRTVKDDAMQLASGS